MAESVHLDLHAIRFDFKARERIFFPRGQAANILRGALGIHLRREIFAPSMALRPETAGHRPSGLADWPRPFVIRARHLDGRILSGGEAFHFDLNVFSMDRDLVDLFVAAFKELAREGFGPGRGAAELLSAVSVPHSVDLNPPPGAPNRIRVDFLSPTELKHEGSIAERPEFPIFFGRIRDRISTLRTLYGPGPLEIDFEAIGARASTVRMTHCNVRRVESRRRSTRTGQVHSIGGFVGSAEYEGQMAEFLPWLEAAQWTGVGRQTVLGKGEIAVTPLCA